jgi:multisubunit Na+/H+ antiporter MnhB subunit
LIRTGDNKLSKWLSYAGLGIGVLLLLCSIQMFVNIRQLLAENKVRKGGSDFISITKTITNETMGQSEKNVFNEVDIRDISAQPFVEGVSPLVANQFRVQLSAGAIIPFQTDLFIETLDNEFIDTVPPTFKWNEGEKTIPIIFSSDFLEIYNVFAPGQGLPQVSEETASGIPILLTCEGNGMEETYTAKVVALSDRVNSVLVPKNFLDWANTHFSSKRNVNASRVFIKTRDANDPQLLQFLTSKNYKVNKDRTRFGRAKQVLQGVFSALGIFGLLVVILAMMLFSFYLQLMIARSKDNLELLMMLGYSPEWVTKTFSRQFVPIYIIVVAAALAVTAIVQMLFAQFSEYQRNQLSYLIHWSVLLAAILLVVLSIVTNQRIVKKLVYKMS